MKDPLFLIDHGASPLERRLLEAGDAEQPSSAARAATLAALGLGSGAVLGSTAAAGVKATGVWGVRSTVAKWWLVGGAFIAGGGAWALWFTTGAPGHGAPSSVRAVAPAHLPGAPARLRGDEVAQPLPTPIEPEAATELERAVAPRPARAGTSARSRAPAPEQPGDAAAPSIQGQIDLIDRARRAVQGSQPSVALAALAEYRASYPRGVLGQEALLLEIEALLQAGKRAAAERLGAQYLERYPRSALAARVRQQLGHEASESP